MGEISWQNFSGVRGESGRGAARHGEKLHAGTVRLGFPPEYAAQATQNLRAQTADARANARTADDAREGKGGAKPEKKGAARGKTPPGDAKSPRATRRPGACGLAAERESGPDHAQSGACGPLPRSLCEQPRSRRCAQRTLSLIIHHFRPRRKGKCVGAAHTKAGRLLPQPPGKALWNYRHHSAPRPVTVSAVRMYRQIEVTYANGIESFR